MISNIKRILDKRKIEYRDVVITGSECGAHSGHIIMNNGFQMGFVFLEPNHLSFTMSKEDFKEQYNIYTKKYANNK